jgi:hypothetical protein
MIKLTNQHGLLETIETTDASFDEARFGEMMFAEIRQIASDQLDADQLARIRATLEKFGHGFSASVNELGIVRTGDAADAARASARRVAENIKNNKSVAAGYKAFWDRNLAENRASIRR